MQDTESECHGLELKAMFLAIMPTSLRIEDEITGIAQLIERRTASQEVMGRSPVWTVTFFVANVPSDSVSSPEKRSVT